MQRTGRGAPVAGGRAAMGLSVGIVALCVAALPNLSTSVWPAKMAVLVVLGAAGLPVLVLRALGRAGRGDPYRPAAVAALAFVAIAAVSTFTSAAVGSAIVGLYQQGTGLVFVAALAGVWALATTVGDAGRPLVEQAIVVGAVLNAAVGVIQQTVGLHVAILAQDGTAATGLAGNAAFFGALCVAGLALLGGRFADEPRRWWLPVALVALGVGASGERIPTLLVAGVVVAEMVAFAVRRTRGGPARVVTLVGFAALSLGSVAAGSLLSTVAGRGGSGVIGRTAQSTTQSTVGVRFDVWRVAATAIGHRPWVGYGPGQFRDAVSSRISLGFARSLGGTIFTDAHNLFVEYATTTGLLGLAALVAWLVLAARRRRGRLVLCAGVLLVFGMAEPLNAVTTSLLFVALGAARIGPDRRRAHPPSAEAAAPVTGVPGGRAGRVAVAVCAVVGLAFGASLVVGDALYARGINHSNGGDQPAAIAAARQADRFLFPWPEPAALAARSRLLDGYKVTPEMAAGAIPWAELAVRRDPTDDALWGHLASAQLDAGRLADAHKSAVRAEQLRPWSVPTLNYLGLIARRQGHPARAHYWFGRSLLLQPHQVVTRSLYVHGCVVSSIHALIPADERCPATSPGG